MKNEIVWKNRKIGKSHREWWKIKKNKEKMEKMWIFSERSERCKEEGDGFVGIFSERSERYQKCGILIEGYMNYGFAWNEERC